VCVDNKHAAKFFTTYNSNDKFGHAWDCQLSYAHMMAIKLGKHLGQYLLLTSSVVGGGGLWGHPIHAKIGITIICIRINECQLVVI